MSAAVFTEEALQFAGPGESLVGVLSRPAAQTAVHSDVAMVVIVGGPQYRVGSHRQFVLLARAVAAQGHVVLRFDYRGMGDSAGVLRDFEAVSDDISCAIDALLLAAPHVKRVVLWGLCDGASAALLYLHDRQDARVAGLALLNPWVRSQASLAKTHVKHYYLDRLKSREFWRKLLSGQVAVSALTGLWSNLRLAFTGAPAPAAAASLPYQQRMARAWSGFAGAILLMLSERDLTAQEFADVSAADPSFQHALRARPPTRVPLADADHTCSTVAAQRAAEEATARWLAQAFAAPAGSAVPAVPAVPA
jgi:uncharacterized protein